MNTKDIYKIHQLQNSRDGLLDSETLAVNLLNSKNILRKTNLNLESIIQRSKKVLYWKLNKIKVMTSDVKLIRLQM